MERNDPSRDYENFSVPYLKRRLEVYEGLKVRYTKFALASYIAGSTVSWSMIALSENPNVELAAVGIYLGGFMVSILGAIDATKNAAESNRIINAAKPKGAGIEGYFKRRIVD